jgi:hypothetical protein
MGDGHNFRQLRARILALSQAGDWDVARKDWSLVDISERVLSPAQSATRQKINKNVMAAISRRGFRGPD